MSDSDTKEWETHSIKVMYDNPWITVSHREVTAPTGKPAVYGLVHFKKTGIAIVPIDSDGNTWLVGQHRYTLDQYMWEIPEGGGLIHEDNLDIAKRELREETGIVANNWTPLLSMHTSNSVTDELCVGFIAQDLEFGDTEPDDTEVLKIRKVPLEQAIEMAMDGTITDALSMVCLFKIKIMLQSGELVT